MQRNMDLVRTIMRRIEESPSGWAEHPFGIAGFTPEQVGYHAHIMMEDGLIEGVDITRMGGKGPEAMPQALTWKGHEFLDLATEHITQRGVQAYPQHEANDVKDHETQQRSLDHS